MRSVFRFGALTAVLLAMAAGSGGTNQPGAPNATVPGTIGTGASPSGLPGDSTTNPGYPGKVGQ
ncbi:MAG: hypothetical protein P4M07_28600 [Xanthobacteraceae bacterium]|nr:hypothetical protein [Xanthobacteraceae bacterium]